ncbi:MAG: TrkA family potassium uptake protein [Christensenellaceae bacterium]|nr:TrkA family potassium uptake protein [Christensenellaceae bacterium]
MKSILIIGLGRFGRHIAMKLNEMNHQVMAVDSSEQRLNDALDFVTSGQIGDATSEAFLSSLGVSDFDACIVAIGDDFQSSLETASLLKELGARHVIARAATGVQEKFLLRNGADEVVYPEKQLASWTAIRCTSDHILDYIDLDGDWAIFELEAPQEWWGRTVLQLDIRRKHGINILGVRVNGVMNMNVAPDTSLPPGSSILVLGQEKAVHRCFRV